MVDVGSQGERFARRRLGWGYDVDEVDAFLARVDTGMVSADEVEQVRLKSRFGGYDEREVDEAFDEIAQRLRAASPPDDRR